VETSDLEGPQRVVVEVWDEEPPEGLTKVHETTFRVGGHGVRVGNHQGGGAADLDLPRGVYPIEVWVDGYVPDGVRRVVFLLGARDAGASA
jgi:hypothetical protein